MGQSKIFKNTAFLFIVRILSSCFSFLLVLFIARKMGPGLLGQFALVFAYFIIFTEFPLLGLNLFISREVAKKNEDLRAFFFIGNFLSFLSLIPLIAILIAIMFFGQYPHDVVWGIFWIIFALFPSAFIAMAQTLFIAFEKIDQLSLAIALENLIRTVGAVIILFNKGNIVDVFLFFFICRLMAMGINIILLKKNKMIPNSFVWDKGVFLFTLKHWPVFLGIYILALVSSKIDFFLLSKLGTIEDLGFYSASYKFLDVLLMAPTAFIYSLFPFLSKNGMTRDVGEMVSAFLRFFSLFAILVVAFFFFGAKDILAMAFGHQFSGAALVFGILIWNFFIVGCDQIMGTVLLSQNRQLADLKMLTAFFVVYIIGLFVLIPQFHYVGAGVATVSSSAFLLGLRFLYLRRAGFNIRLDGFWKNAGLALVLFVSFYVLKQLLILPFFLAWVLFATFYLLGVSFLGIFTLKEKESFFYFVRQKLPFIRAA
ncbi:MAG: oligosaccharide flippase family protein [Candidatus Omnitrophica bacterium]|nr:oligosaccharide flippase family protein [Candidatus Omnitrophota bacterium]